MLCRCRVDVNPNVGMAFQFRWQCEELIRASSAYIGVHECVNFFHTWEKVPIKCRKKDCPACMTLDWQPSTKLWKMNKFVVDCDECKGQDLSSIYASSQKKASALLLTRPSRLLLQF